MSNPGSITVRLFSVLRERLGRDVLLLDAEAAPTVEDAIGQLGALHPDIQAYRRWIRVAVNHDYVTGEHKLAPGDEMALITPVSGG